MKRLAAGAEIDSWCTKCKLDLGHRIVAMVGDGPKRVICMTCGSEHNYRAPKTGAAAPKPKAKKTGAKRQTVAQMTEAARREEWRNRVEGRSADEFAAYRIDDVFQEGQLIAHRRFGNGYVSELLDGNKVSVMFEDGAKTLVHGHGS